MQRMLSIGLIVVAPLFSPIDTLAQSESITLAREAPVYPVMSLGADPVTTLPAGTVVAVVTRRPAWILIRYAGNRQGYLRTADLSEQTPASVQAGACTDSLYQALRRKDINTMTEREWAYFQEHDRACLAEPRTQVSSAVPQSQAQPPAALTLTRPPPPARQVPAPTSLRQGFWFSGGLGYGTLGCLDCDGRLDGLSGGLAVGGTISQKVLLAVATNGWTRTEDGVTLSAGSLTGSIRFYPSERGNFFLLGGLGVGRVDVTISGLDSASGIGYSAVLGLGYDIRIGKMTSLTPFWNGIGIADDYGDVNFGQIGLSFTIH